MYNENNTLSPAKIELISNVSGTYSTPFWDGLREVTGTLDTIRKIKTVLETLYAICVYRKNQVVGFQFSSRLIISIGASTAIKSKQVFPALLGHTSLSYRDDVL